MVWVISARIALRCCDVTGVSPVLGMGAFGFKAEGSGVPAPPAPAPPPTPNPDLPGRACVVALAVTVDEDEVLEVVLDWEADGLGGAGARRKLELADEIGARLSVGPVGNCKALKFLFVRRVREIGRAHV